MQSPLKVSEHNVSLFDFAVYRGELGLIIKDEYETLDKLLFPILTSRSAKQLKTFTKIREEVLFLLPRCEVIDLMISQLRAVFLLLERIKQGADQRAVYRRNASSAP